MKLYYSPGACSLSPHIVLRELGLSFDLEKVDIQAHTTASGGDYLAINPKGCVPALQLDSGEVLTEGVAIVQYLADQHPQAGLAPQAGTMARARLQEHLNFIAAEVHMAFGPLFSPATPDDAREAAKANVARRASYLETHVFADGRPYLMGDAFSVADCYLFVVLNWSGHVGISLDAFPKVKAYLGLVGARATVQAALKAEGLTKD